MMCAGAVTDLYADFAKILIVDSVPTVSMVSGFQKIFDNDYHRPKRRDSPH